TFTIRQRLIESYRVGRVFFAGDAAHAHSPVGGRGMNTGIQDAYNLGWKLGGVVTGRLTPEVLDSYELERYPVGAQLVSQTTRGTRAAVVSNPVAQMVRNRLAHIGTRIPFVQRRIVNAV